MFVLARGVSTWVATWGVEAPLGLMYQSQDSVSQCDYTEADKTVLPNRGSPFLN